MATDDLNPRKGKRTIERTYLSLVNQRDPQRRKELLNEPEYEFSNGRVFTANRAHRGAYTPSWDRSFDKEFGS